MARSTFGGFGGDQVSLDPAGNSGFYKAAANYNATGTFWGTQTGTSTPYTDLIDPVTSVALAGVSTDAHGHVVPFKGPNGITEGWLDFGGGRFKVTAVDSGIFLPVATLDGRYAPITGSATYESGTSTVIYVSTSGNDSRNGQTWGTAKATIAGALTTLGNNAGTIMLGTGTFTISAADTNGNGVTLTHAGQRLIGQGSNATTVLINASVTWGVKLTAQFSQLAGVYVSIATGQTVSYGVGVGTPTSSGSAEFCRFTDVFVNCAGTVTAAFALGPDFPGSSTVDIADTVLDACVFNGAPTHGYLFGNGTSGNVLMHHMISCGGSGAQYGLTLAGSGVTWFGGGFSNNTVSDIHITQGTTDTVLLSGLRCENGKRFLDVGYIGGITGGVTLNDCVVGSYTPSDNKVIEYDSYSPLNIIGGYYDAGAGSLISVNSAGGSPAIPFTAIGVELVNASGWPAYNPARVIRTILNASYNNAGVSTPLTGFTALLDGRFQVVNVKDYGAKGDGTTDDTTAITNAINAVASGGRVYFPESSSFYKITSALPLKTGVTYFGASRASVEVRATTGNVFAPTTSVSSIVIEGLTLSATSAHIIDLGTTGGLYQATIRDCSLVPRGNAVSAINGNGSITWQEVYVENTILNRLAGATVPGVNLISSVGGLNGSVWQKLVIYSNLATGTPYFHVEASGAGTYVYDNVFRDIVGEQNVGGLVHIFSAQNVVVENVVDWDVSGSYTGSIVKIDKGGGGFASRGRVAGVGNRGGTVNGTSVYHVEIANSANGPIQLERIGDQAGNCYIKSISPTYGFARVDGWGMSGQVRTTTASATASDILDGTLVFNGASLTATLPDPTTVPYGRKFTVKNINASSLTVVSAGTSKTIDGAASKTLAQWAWITVQTDSTQWLIVG